MNIAIAVCKDLADRGYNVMALGIGYTGGEHDWPFTILPVNTRQAFVHIPAMLQNLRTLENAGQVPHIQAIVVALDIPMHERLLSMPMREGIPYIGIFPIESGPLCQTWANVLNRMDEACVISKFGLDQMIDISVPGRYLPIGLDTEAWRRPLPAERAKLREAMGYTDDQLVVLTVADNQERKNLSAAMEAIRITAENGIDAQWMLVTRIASQVGWKLDDMAIQKGVMDRFVKFERGLDFQKLWTLYAIADVFLLTSKAEGLCNFPDNQILTSKGRDRIKNISEGDLVYTHKGHKQSVTKVFERDYQGDLIVIQPRYGLESIKLTPEHPVLAMPRRRKGGKIWGKRRLLFGEGAIWTPAWSLAKDDFLFVPFPERQDKSHISIEDYFEPDYLGIEGDNVVLKGSNQHGATYNHPKARRHKNKVEVDDDLLFILGLYIAEGCWTAQGPDFSLSTKEVELQDRLIDSMERKFGIIGRVKIKSRHRWSCRYDDRLIGRLLSRLCGKSSHVKHIPSWALFLPKEKLWKILEGMFLGDGHFRKSKQPYLSYSTVSEDLANDLQTALIGLGIMPYMNRSKRGDFDIKIYEPDLGKVAFLNDYKPLLALKKSARFERIPGGLAIPIKSVDVISYVGKVHNLEVENDESYLISNVAIHNCMPVMEAMATGAVVVATDCTAVPEHIFDDREERKGQRGFVIDPEYLHQDPWGNSIRTYADAQDAADLLSLVNEMKISGTLEKDIIAPARAYVESRTWEKCGEVLDEAIRNVMLKEVPFDSAGAGLEPATVPRVIPIPVEAIDDQEGQETQAPPPTDFATTVPSATKAPPTEGEEGPR